MGFKVGDRVFCEGFKRYGTISHIINFYTYKPVVPLVAVTFDGDDELEYMSYDENGVGTSASREGNVSAHDKYKIRHLNKLEKAMT